MFIIDTIVVIVMIVVVVIGIIVIVIVVIIVVVIMIIVVVVVIIVIIIVVASSLSLRSFSSSCLSVVVASIDIMSARRNFGSVFWSADWGSEMCPNRVRACSGPKWPDFE